MEVRDCSLLGRILLRVVKATPFYFEGRVGVVMWDAGRLSPALVKVRWCDDDTETGLIHRDGVWRQIQTDIVDAFIGEPAVIELSHRKLGDEKIEEVAQILESSDLFIKSLCLNYCQINDAGAARLADAIESNDYVRTVDLFGNMFSTVLRYRIEDMLWYRNNRVLLLTVDGVRKSRGVVLNFMLLTGDELFPSLTLDSSVKILELRTTLQARPEARKFRKIELVLPEPNSRHLRDTDDVGEVVLDRSVKSCQRC